MANVYPENTLAAYRGTVALGVGVVEPDCWRTRDGGLVCLHDATVDRTTDGSGNTDELTMPASTWSSSAPGIVSSSVFPEPSVVRSTVASYSTNWAGKRSCAPRRRTPARAA